MQETIPFYKTFKWKKCREGYMKHARGLCEECLKKGLIVPAEIVHHKIPLNADNMNDPSIALSWDNLEAVCRKCHAEIHDDVYAANQSKTKKRRRYRVDEFGRVESIA